MEKWWRYGTDEDERDAIATYRIILEVEAGHDPVTIVRLADLELAMDIIDKLESLGLDKKESFKFEKNMRKKLTRRLELRWKQESNQVNWIRVNVQAKIKQQQNRYYAVC